MFNFSLVQQPSGETSLLTGAEQDLQHGVFKDGEYKFQYTTSFDVEFRTQICSGYWEGLQIHHSIRDSEHREEIRDGVLGTNWTNFWKN